MCCPTYGRGHGWDIGNTRWLISTGPIQYYQSKQHHTRVWLFFFFFMLTTSTAILYKDLGIGTTTILALSGVYGTIAFGANVLTTLFLTDQWGRRKYVFLPPTSQFHLPIAGTPALGTGPLTHIRMILSGLTAIILIEIYAAVMQREFQDTDNKLGKGFAILGIYLFVVAYCECESDHTRVLNHKSLGLPNADGPCRWYAQQYNLAIRGGSLAHGSSEQGHGARRGIPFHRERRP